MKPTLLCARSREDRRRSPELIGEVEIELAKRDLAMVGKLSTT